MLWITDGENSDKDPTPKMTNYNTIVASELATETGLVTASLFQVPNASILFPSDPKKKHRSEDDLVAFSWAKYLNNTDKPEWIIFLPMVKSAVRAMDTVEQFLGAGVNDTDYAGNTY